VGRHWYFSAVALAGGACLAGYTLYVWRHRRASAGASLAVMLAAAGWWGLAYAIELAATDLATRKFWGDTKWLGIALLPVAFYAFVMQYTGRDLLVNRRTMAALAVVPVATVALLAVPATHDLVRYYPPEAAADPADAIAQVGPLFWPFLVYADLVIWGSTALFVWTLTRLSRRYWRQSLLLIAAVLLPSLANVAHNLNLGPLREVEPTPFLFVLTGAVLVWGLFRFRLLDLAPIARSSVFETMLDAVLVLDPYRRVVNLNPAAERALGVPAGQAVGLPVEQLLGVAASLVERADDPALPEELELGGRRFELSTTPLRDRGGRVTGRLLVLRDVTERHLAHERLLRLDEQRRWLLGRVVWAQEEERRRIAGEVHDDAIQTIAAARLMLTTFRDQLTDDRQRRLLDHLEEAVSTSLARLRTLVFDLRPAQLDDDGLAAALREYLAETAGQGRLEAELRDELEREPPAEVRVIAYRICQEALTNVRVHARARRVEVRLEEAQGGLQVTVTDDGDGFDPDRVRAIPRRGHLGLTSMSERARMADGWCRVDSTPGAGTTVRFWLPTKDTGEAGWLPGAGRP
jgi:PAS domain S-box-containing protein